MASTEFEACAHLKAQKVILATTDFGRTSITLTQTPTPTHPSGELAIEEPPSTNVLWTGVGPHIATQKIARHMEI
jgi:hypothetical protein